VGPPIQVVLIQLFFSGLVAATISFLLNRNDERGRTARDHLTKLFDAAREDVAEAMEAGVAYYTGVYSPLAEGKRSPDNVRLLEARVLLAERNVRAATAVLMEISYQESGRRLRTLIPLEGAFVVALTERFGAPDPADPEAARRVVLSGAPLRQHLAMLRQGQLSSRGGVGRAALLLLAFLFIGALGLGVGLFGRVLLGP
jgi:hypothetical protein